MNCRRKGGQTASIYVRPVEGGEVSTVIGLSYVKLANSLEVYHSPIKFNPASESSLSLKLVGGFISVLRRPLVEDLLQTAGTYHCIQLP